MEESIYIGCNNFVIKSAEQYFIIAQFYINLEHLT